MNTETGIETVQKKIKLFDPYIGVEEEKAITRVLHSGFWASGAGTGNVAKFEHVFNKFVGSRQCIAVNSGTAALHLALKLFDIRNKEVIIPSLSFVATAHAVLYNGGKPVFVDVDSETLCVDPDVIKKSISKKTRVILPVHFGGMPSNLTEIMSICNENNINLVEDAAHASGASFKGKNIGQHGHAVCFSFHPVKNLAMPGGGAITLNGIKSNIFAKILKESRWFGISDRHGPFYDVKSEGWNYYMNEFSAAIGIEQLKKLDVMNKMRKNIAKQYFNEINLEHKMPLDENCSYHLYWIRVKNRSKFIKKMAEYNIEVGIHYKPIHTMSYYNVRQNLPITKMIENELVSIPMHPNLTNSDISRVINAVNEFS